MNRKTSSRTHKCCVGCHIFQLCIYTVWCSIEHLYICFITIFTSISVTIYICMRDILSILEKKDKTTKCRMSVRARTVLVSPNRAVCRCLNRNCLPVTAASADSSLKELHGLACPAPTVWSLCEQCAASPAHFPASSLQPAAALPAGQQLIQATRALN